MLIHASLDFAKEIIDVKKFFDECLNISVILPELTRYQDIRDVD